MSRMKARVAGLLLGMMATVGSSRAWAMPGEVAVGGELGVGMSTRASWSPTVGVRGAYGVAEALELQLELSGQWFRPQAPTVPNDGALLRLVPALAYKFDVLRWVPFARLGAGPTLDIPTAKSNDPHVGFALQGGVGAEYLIDRSLSFGFAYQADWVTGAGDWANGLAPMHRLLLSLGWRSGW